MRNTFLCSTVVALALVAPTPKTAEACGGCFIAQSESTQVTGHRMLMSISQEQTTLYDQITYDGAPEEFAWILPIRGQVEVGLSSDLLFSQLEALTTVTVESPTISCSPPPDCGSGGAGGGFASSGDGGGGGGYVEVIAAEVVGPYETVQLSSTDPNALVDWLTTKGFAVPPEIQPVIDDYVEEGFDFLALRLVPGADVDSMRPVRITTPGASPDLPLRMVAAGTGAKTVVNLWVVGDGRYEPQNFPSFEISSDDIVWNWDTQKSNYATLRQAGFDDSQGFAWHTAAADTYADWAFAGLLNTATYDPIGSGYGEPDGTGAIEAAEEDVATLLTDLDPQSFWITRLDAELSRNALLTDLRLEASLPQDIVPTELYATGSVGTPPTCPQFDPCDDDDDGGLGGGGCTVSTVGSAPVSLSLLAAMALAASRRRRRRR